MKIPRGISISSIRVLAIAGGVVLAIAGGFCSASLGAEGKAPGRPALIRLQENWLLQTKKRILSGDPSLQAAFSKLLRDAGSSINAGPYTVVDKPLAPPSADKHDYMSLAPYWWPNPLSEDGLPYVRRDGETNPASKTEASDSPRLVKMVNAVESLTLAYYFTGEEKYAAAAALQLRTWFLNGDTRMNPHLRYGQSIPGRSDGRAAGIIETRNLTRVIDAIGLLAGSKALSGQEQAGLEEWFKSFLGWLQTSKEGKSEDRAKNNHGSWYDVQVADLALFTGNKELARDVLEAAKTRRLAAQIQPGGKQPYELARTRSFDYSVMNLDALFFLARLGEHVDVSLWNFGEKDRSGIRAALDYLAPCADPQNTWPHPQLGKINRSRLLPLLLQGTLVFASPEYAQLIAKLPAKEARRHRSLLLYPG